MTTIALDFDDTLVDTMPCLLDWIETSYGFRVAEERLANYQLGADAGETDAIVEAFFAGGAHRRITAIEGAVEACLGFRQAGYRLVVVTSRKPDAAPLTMDLIDRLFPDIFADVHSIGHLSDKAARLRSIEARLLIDDHFRHVAAAAAAGIPSILFRDLPWNREPRWNHRASTWPEALVLSRSLLRVGAPPPENEAPSDEADSAIRS